MGNLLGKSAGKNVSITDKDRAILDLKVQRDKLKQYQKKILTVIDREVDVAKTHLRNGDKRRALIALKKKKYQIQLLDQTDTQLLNLEQLTNSIEYALVERDVLKGLEQGNSVLKEIHKEMSVEAVQKLMDDTADAIAYQNEIEQVLSAKLTEHDEAAIEAELDAIEEEQRVDLPSVPKNPLPKVQVPELTENVPPGQHAIKAQNHRTQKEPFREHESPEEKHIYKRDPDFPAVYNSVGRIQLSPTTISTSGHGSGMNELSCATNTTITNSSMNLTTSDYIPSYSFNPRPASTNHQRIPTSSPSIAACNIGSLRSGSYNSSQSPPKESDKYLPNFTLINLGADSLAPTTRTRQRSADYGSTYNNAFSNGGGGGGVGGGMFSSQQQAPPNQWSYIPRSVTPPISYNRNYSADEYGEQYSLPSHGSPIKNHQSSEAPPPANSVYDTARYSGMLAQSSSGGLVATSNPRDNGNQHDSSDNPFASQAQNHSTSTTVTVTGCPPALIPQLNSLLRKCGDMVEYQEGANWVRVVFRTRVEAEKAVEMLDGETAGGNRIAAQIKTPKASSIFMSTPCTSTDSSSRYSNGVGNLAQINGISFAAAQASSAGSSSADIPNNKNVLDSGKTASLSTTSPFRPVLMTRRRPSDCDAPLGIPVKRRKAQYLSTSNGADVDDVMNAVRTGSSNGWWQQAVDLFKW
ncbi:hypothetical protein SeLEV6574_g00032 [Synchytrium endobioticum]|uniref:RRM domain-containing protein n=1 Tax=Synchytrium endobioticum TaxID=286115 RepID=A0A507DJC6_9FUNG|nr:hypothetical protein SeLEV6574_g00032 [Synchytrium endobioticum]